MLTIRWGLDDVGIYTLNEAVIKINTVLSYQWDIDDLVRHAQERTFRLFCKIDDVPVVKARWGRCFHIQEIIQYSPFTLFPDRKAEFDRCEIIEEISCFSGFCNLPAAQLRLLAQGQHPIHLSHIEELDREGCPTTWEVMNLPAWIERYEPLLSEVNSSHQVLVECLKLNLKGTEREYLEELQGTVAISLNQCWIAVESVEGFIEWVRQQDTDEGKNDGLTRRQKQMNALVRVLRTMHLVPMSLEVGDGTKDGIHKACVLAYPRLFTESKTTFNGIWVDAVKSSVIKVTKNKRAKEKGV